MTVRYSVIQIQCYHKVKKYQRIERTTDKTNIEFPQNFYGDILLFEQFQFHKVVLGEAQIASAKPPIGQSFALAGPNTRLTPQPNVRRDAGADASGQSM